MVSRSRPHPRRVPKSDNTLEHLKELVKTFDLPRCIIIYFFPDTSTSVILGIFYILWFGTLED